MAEIELENPAPTQNAGADNKLKEIYIRTIIKQIHETIRAEDFINKSLNDLVAAASGLNEQVLYIISENFKRVADERLIARRAMRKIYKIAKNKKHIIKGASRAKLIIYTVNLLRALNVIHTIYIMLGEINSIYYNKQVKYKEIIYKIEALIYFAKELLLSL